MKMGLQILLLVVATSLAIYLFDLISQLAAEMKKLEEAGVKNVELKIDVKGKR